MSSVFGWESSKEMAKPSVFKFFAIRSIIPMHGFSTWTSLRALVWDLTQLLTL